MSYRIYWRWIGVLCLLVAVWFSVAAGDAPFAEAQRQDEVFEDLPNVPTVKSDAELPSRSSKQLTFDDFVQKVVGENLDDFWSELFAQAKHRYRSPTLRVVYGSVPIRNAPKCGSMFNPSEGPTYCNGNETIYIPANYRVPSTKLLMDEHGDFALAYLVAHEWGHHLQKLVGLSDQKYRTRDGKELQADCLAGVWGRSTHEQGLLESSDLDEAMLLAQVIGDDVLGVPKGQGIHGDAKERETWFAYGFLSGDSRKCVAM
jgi:uncharacterized protein